MKKDADWPKLTPEEKATEAAIAAKQPKNELTPERKAQLQSIAARSTAARRQAS